MTTIEIKGAPCTIVKYSGDRKNPRKADGEGGSPVRAKTVELMLDVSDERFRMPLLAVFPGADLLISALAGEEPECPASVLTMARTLGDVAVLVSVGQDGEMEEVFRGAVCKVVGKPSLRIAAGAVKVEMPFRVRMPIARDVIQRIDDATGADCMVNIVTVPDEDREAPAEKPKRSRKSKDKVSVPVADVAEPMANGDGN